MNELTVMIVGGTAVGVILTMLTWLSTRVKKITDVLSYQELQDQRMKITEDDIKDLEEEVKNNHISIKKGQSELHARIDAENAEHAIIMKSMGRMEGKLDTFMQLYKIDK